MNTEGIRGFLRRIWSQEPAFLGVLVLPLAQGGLEELANTIQGFMVPVIVLGWAVAGVTWVAAVLMKHFSGASRGVKEQAHRSMDEVIILAILLTVGVGILSFIYTIVSGAFPTSSPEPTWE